MNAGEWIDAYARAWEQADEEAIVALFTPDAVYRSSPFREPHVGADAIRAYWRRGAGTQRDVRVRLGAPVVDGRRVAVEWWATGIDADEGDFTLPGILMLRFDADGVCEELRECWHSETGRREPHEGWGR
ncbi:MAG: nuclear transport factor 2 family protein [Actinomycetota bacterium]|nr:nuclear transport factor 2 family protein [Actinomycetota bacterium]